MMAYISLRNVVKYGIRVGKECILSTRNGSKRMIEAVGGMEDSYDVDDFFGGYDDEAIRVGDLF